MIKKIKRNECAELYQLHLSSYYFGRFFPLPTETLSLNNLPHNASRRTRVQVQELVFVTINKPLMSSVLTNGLKVIHHQLRIWADYIKEIGTKLVVGIILINRHHNMVLHFLVQ